MAGIIKKQLLKHLALFCNDVDPSKLNFSLTKGELDLPNISLNTDALHSLLNIPTWLSINSAIVERVKVKIPILHITKTPIRIEMSSVSLEVQILDTPRSPNKPSPLVAAAGDPNSEAVGGSYGMIQKVLEGISISIESVQAKIKSTAFQASIMMGPIEVFSTDFRWNVPSDLKYSRVYDGEKRRQVLTFKAINCQMLRIEATATKTAATKNGKWSLTPLKVILSQFELRLTLRRRTKDCRMLCSKGQILFDDLLWILTDSQVRAALLCAKTIQDAMKKSVAQAQKLGLVTENSKATEEENASINLNAMAAQQAQSGEDLTSKYKNYDDRPDLEMFRRLCPIETSMHAQFRRLEFHIYEESITSTENIESKRESVAPNGATQIIFETIQIDHYPAHRAATSRKNFIRYTSSMQERDQWANNSVLQQFREDFALLKQQAAMANNLERQNQNASKLYESILLIHVANVEIFPVACDHRKVQQSGGLINAKTKMIGAQRDLLTKNIPFLHADLTNYFYPDGRDYPQPHANIFIDCNAPEILVDWLSLEWLSQIALETAKAVTQMLDELGVVIDKSKKPDHKSKHVDIRVELKSAKFWIVNEKSYEANIKKKTLNENIFPICCDLYYPKGIEVNLAKMIMTNNRDNPKNGKLFSTRTDLNKLIEKYPDGTFNLLTDHAMGLDTPIKKIMLNLINPKLKSDSLISHAENDVWCLLIDALWIDWIYSDNCFTDNNLTMHACERIFLEPTSLELWLALCPAKSLSSKDRLEFVSKLGSNLGNAQSGTKSPQIMINHYQLQTILNIVEDCLEAVEYFDKLGQYLAPTDALGNKIVNDSEITASINIPGLDAFLLLEPFAQFNLISSIKIDIPSLITANSNIEDSKSSSGASTIDSKSVKNMTNGSNPAFPQSSPKQVDVASEALVESTADLLFPMDGVKNAENHSLGSEINAENHGNGENGKNSAGFGFQEAQELHSPLKSTLQSAKSPLNINNSPASSLSKPPTFDILSENMTSSINLPPQVPCNSVASQHLNKNPLKSKSTQTRPLQKTNEFLEISKNNDRVSSLHTTVLSIRQSIEVFIHSKDHITIIVKHIELDDMGLLKLMDIGALIGKFAQRRPLPITVSASSANRGRNNRSINERDSEVMVDIYPSGGRVEIDASNVDLKVSAAFLANIGPFAELDVVKTVKKDKLNENNENSQNDEKLNEQLSEEDSIPEINIKARLVNFTIEPDNNTVHQENLSSATPFQICIPYRGIEVTLKIADGKLEIIKLLQEEVLSSGAKYNDTVSRTSVSTMEELEVNRLQECEQKLVNQVNGLTKQLDRLGMEKETYKSQVDLLDDQLKKANSDKQALEDAYEVLLQEFLKTQNK